MFSGHVAFVQKYDAGTGLGEMYGSQSSTGPAEVHFTTTPGTMEHYWGGVTEKHGHKDFLGFLSVKAPYDPAGAAAQLAALEAKRAPALKQLRVTPPYQNPQDPVSSAPQQGPATVAPEARRPVQAEKPAETPTVRQPRSSETTKQTLPPDKRGIDEFLLDKMFSIPRSEFRPRPSDGQKTPPTNPLQFAPDEADPALFLPGSNQRWPIRELGNGHYEAPAPISAVPNESGYDDTSISSRRGRLGDPNAPAGIAGDDLDGSLPDRPLATDAAPNAPENPTVRKASISIVVGAGLPGHTTSQIDKGDKTTYLGLAPKAAGENGEAARFDVVTLDKDVSPVAALRNEAKKSGEYHYVDARDYDVKAFTLPISDEQADKAVAAALKYQVKNPKFNGSPVLVSTDYALNVLEAAIPGSDASALSRIPSLLQKELVSLSARGDGLSPVRGDRNPLGRTGLTGLQQEEKPPEFNIKRQFNDKVPFNFASGEVGISGQPRESKAQVSLKRAGDGSAELSVGDSTFVNFEPGQLSSVANSDGKLRLSFSKSGGRDKLFGNVMAVDAGTGDVSVLDKHGRLSNLEAGSRINITSDGWDHANEAKPSYLERPESERAAAGFG